MSSTTATVERSAAASYVRAAAAAPVTGMAPALAVLDRDWTTHRSIATGAKRSGLNPTPRPEEAAP